MINLEFKWCRDIDQVKDLSILFAENITPDYISHSELQSYRAIDVSNWASDIKQIFYKDIIERLNNSLDAASDSKTHLISYLEIDGINIAVFLVTFARDSITPYAVIEDMMIAPDFRYQGIGNKFIKWFEDECVKRNIRRIFIESGKNNKNTHLFFEREGFNKISVVMMKDI